MRARRITEITVETDETFTLRRDASAGQTQCAQCGSAAATLSHPQSAALFWAAIRSVGSPVAQDGIHVAKAESGAMVICLDSLRKAAPQLPGKSILKISQIKENPS